MCTSQGAVHVMECINLAFFTSVFNNHYINVHDGCSIIEFPPLYIRHLAGIWNSLLLILIS